MEDKTHLPPIFEKKDSIKNIKTKNIKNYKNRLDRIIEKVKLDDNLSKIKITPIRKCFYNKLENPLNKREGKTNKSAKLLINKSLNELNCFRIVENYNSVYASKLPELLDNKIIYESKKERNIQLKEIQINKIEFEDAQKKSLNKSQDLLEQKFMTNCEKYLSKIIDIQEDIDKILWDKIIELKKEVHLLKKKIDLLLTEKFEYLKWMLFQMQINEKILKLPKQYKDLFQINKKLPDNLMKYKKEIIYPSPEELIDGINSIKNNTINLMNILYKIKKQIFLLKMKLQKVNINLEQNKYKYIDKFNVLLKSKEKVSAENDLLIKRIITIKNTLIINTSKTKETNNSKVFEKIRYIYNNIFDRQTKKRKNKKEEEILSMLTYIEIKYNQELEKNKYYKIKYKKQYKEIETIVIKKIIKENIIKNKNKLKELKELENQRIMEKVNKKLNLPKIKINLDAYKVKKKYKSLININNYNKENDEIEKSFEYFCYD